MSYTVGYYIAMFIGALGGLAWIASFACGPLAGYLFIRGMMLTQQQKPTNEPLGALVDWTDGAKMMKQGVLVILVAFPLLYLLAHIIPDTKTAMIHMGFEQDTPCMSGDQTGVLISATSEGTTLYATFTMKDGVSIMCRIDGMNAAGTISNTTYRVKQGKLVS